MRLIAVGLFFIFGIQVSQAAYKVELQSTYDTPSGQTVVKGTGVYVADALWRGTMPTPSRFFILSVAHVTQGRDLKIKIDNESLEILGRHSMSRKDIELIEVRPSRLYAPLAIWYPQFKAFINIFSKQAQSAYFKSAWGNEIIQPFFVGNEMSDSGQAASLVQTNRPFIALPADFKNVKAKAFDSLNNDILRATLFKNMSNQVVFKARIAPGMSGSPLFVSEAMITYTIEVVNFLTGLASQFSRYQDHSFTVGIETIAQLYLSYVKSNKRGELVENLSGAKIKTIWRHNGKSTYRFVQAVDSATPLALESSVLLPEAGDGTNGDGGDGTNGDGGDGTNGDGGDHSLEKLKPSQPTEMSYQNNPARFFEVINKSSGEKIVLQANMAALDFILNHQKCIIVKAISRQITPYQLFLNRASNFKFMGTVSPLYSSVQVKQKVGGFEYHLAYMNRNNRGHYDKVVMSPNEKDIRTAAGEVGRWDDRFMKMTSQDDASKRIYIVDLDDLSALNLQQVPTLPKKNGKTAQRSFADEWPHILEYYRAPYIFLNIKN